MIHSIGSTGIENENYVKRDIETKDPLEILHFITLPIIIHPAINNITKARASLLRWL